MYYWSLPVKRAFRTPSRHLDARPNHARNFIQPLSGIHDFVQQVARYGSVISYCSVHLDARPNHARNIIQPFRVFTISCNKLHATGSVIPYCSVHLDARKISPRCGMKCGGFWVCFSCNKLHATGDYCDKYSRYLASNFAKSQQNFSNPKRFVITLV